MMRKVFEIMMIGGCITFMLMAFMMLFIDFTKLEIAIPLAIMVIGLFGDEYYTNQMRIKRHKGCR